MIKLKLNIRGDKIEITPAMRDYIQAKLTKLLKYFGGADEIEINVVVKVRSGVQTIEVTVPTTKFTLRAEESHRDLYAATDLVVDILERQIRKNKTRLNNRFQKEQQIPDFNFNFEEKEENKNKVVRRKNIESKPMDEEEAILQMELLNHDFFVFNNIDEDAVSVIYKRKDGNYGLININ